MRYCVCCRKVCCACSFYPFADFHYQLSFSPFPETKQYHNFSITSVKHHFLILHLQEKLYRIIYRKKNCINQHICAMDSLQHEQYDYARKRIRQKKNVFIHFVVFLIGSIFLYIVNKCLEIDAADNWYLWAITGWAFLFIMHFIRVFITDAFMNKNWEHHQIEKLVAMQQKRIKKLETKIESQENTKSL